MRVLFAIGDCAGPLAGEIRIATSSRRNFEEVLKQAQTWRGEKIIVHFAHVIQGSAPTQKVRTGIEDILREQGMHIRKSWWRVGVRPIDDIVDLVACREGVLFLTEAEADALERKKQDEYMSRMLP